MARILDDGLLQRLDALVAARSPAALTPGVDASEVRERLGDANLAAPAEVVMWWSRHDGWRRQTGGLFEVIPGLQSLSLAEALRLHDRWLGFARDEASGAFSDLKNPEDFFHPAWLPIFATGHTVIYLADTRETADGGCPVRYLAPDEVGQPDYAAVLAGSLGELIDDAVDAIEHGDYEFDAATGTWEAVADRDTSNPFTQLKRPERRRES